MGERTHTPSQDAVGFTKGQLALVRLMEIFSRRHVTLEDAKRHGLEDEFYICREAGMLVHAGYETSAAAEEWLDSPAGRRALAKASPHV